MRYSPACPLSALWDPLPAALHSWVSSLKSELQGMVNAARAAPAAPLVLPLRAMLCHLQSDAAWTGQSPTRQQETQNHRHLAGLLAEDQNSGLPEHIKFSFYQNEIVSKIGQIRSYSIYPFELLGASGEQIHQIHPRIPEATGRRNCPINCSWSKPFILRS